MYSAVVPHFWWPTMKKSGARSIASRPGATSLERAAPSVCRPSADRVIRRPSLTTITGQVEPADAELVGDLVGELLRTVRVCWSHSISGPCPKSRRGRAAEDVALQPALDLERGVSGEVIQLFLVSNVSTVSECLPHATFEP